MDINAQTQLCGLLGNPVDHSLSPTIHNAAFRQLGLNFVYLAFPVQDLEGAVQGLRALGHIRGLSVTIPHKVTILPLLDSAETTAKHIGSVNTIVKDRGLLVGSNTDASGALKALQHGGVETTGQRVVILGSGGAARAIAFALGVEGKIEHLTLLGVDDQERKTLATDLKAKTSILLHDNSLTPETLQSALAQAQLLIHCTPIGMHPKVEESCVPKHLLHRDLTVMDIVYNPLNTRLLQDAQAAGCRTIQGINMFLYQAVGQFELWTGQSAPIEVMRNVLTSHFS
ncbi:shikimate dehydrogenase [Candidatus Nitrospira allomarina]|jgi:shikimate dehydrogenase|uniref:Shikimate dehydrogenase (NADP(+)) n=1 Tax=Candidatus Nitrospira allomarina TaxID=3020900 RepID=A0AA96GCX8_9BACT|nr:shikimate dehydrogenase [Candidatus Nitrospira allomarina]WNM59316.1 shikimate dehydrogenase [Candidatus Nitrospira allomarina]